MIRGCFKSTVSPELPRVARRAALVFLLTDVDLSHAELTHDSEHKVDWRVESNTEGRPGHLMRGCRCDHGAVRSAEASSGSLSRGRAPMDNREGPARDAATAQLL